MYQVIHIPEISQKNLVNTTATGDRFHSVVKSSAAMISILNNKRVHGNASFYLHHPIKKY